MTRTTSACASESTRSISSRPAEDGHALHPAAAQAWVVVDEADDVLARRLAQLAEEAAAAAARADDERAPPRVAVLDRAERVEERPLAEARGADQSDAEERVDDVDAGREVAERPEAEPDDPDRDRPRDDDRRGDRRRLARAGEAPDAAVEPEGDEGDVAARQDHGQRDEEDVLLVGRPVAGREQEVGDRRTPR